MKKASIPVLAIRMVLILSGLLGVSNSATLADSANQPEQSQPGFDCSKVQSDVEKEICKSPELSRLDAEIAAAYVAARKLLDAAGESALLASQRDFIELRNHGKTAWDFVLKDHLRRRRDLLREIRPSRGEWAGEWGNDYGRMTLLPRSDGLYDIKILAGDPAGGRWACEFDYGGKISGSRMITWRET
jgi:uncharacterized protein YecT (DUF1311 family)